MAEPKPEKGTVAWTDLTVDDAESVRDFYKQVVGWRVEPVDMGGYADYNMCGPSGTPLAGVCHARGPNADLPPVWLIYVHVDDLDQSIERCQSLGGHVVSGPKSMGSVGRYCVIQDPAGAHLGLIEQNHSGISPE